MVEDNAGNTTANSTGAVREFDLLDLSYCGLEIFLNKGEDRVSKSFCQSSKR